MPLRIAHGIRRRTSEGVPAWRMAVAVALAACEVADAAAAAALVPAQCLCTRCLWPFCQPMPSDGDIPPAAPCLCRVGTIVTGRGVNMIMSGVSYGTLLLVGLTLLWTVEHIVITGVV